MRPAAQMRIAHGGWSLLSLQAALRAAEEPAEPTSRLQFTVRPATSEIRVDSVLDEPAWEQAEVYVAFRASDPEHLILFALSDAG